MLNGLFRFGQKRSNVHVLDLFPSIEEYEAEMQAEKHWWKDVDSSKKNLARFEEIKAKKKLQRNRLFMTNICSLLKSIYTF